MRKMMQYRLYPTTAQTLALETQLAEACRLYNAALQERRDAYQREGLSLTYYDQANQLKAIREDGACGLANFSASRCFTASGTGARFETSTAAFTGGTGGPGGGFFAGARSAAFAGAGSAGVPPMATFPSWISLLS